MSATDTTARPRGRQFFANPGPTNIPDSVLLAVAHHTVDFNDPAFMEVYEACFEGLKRVLKTRRGQLFMYTGSGHAAWEASLVNLFSPGDAMLILETGHFSDTWGNMARDLGLVVRQVAADWRQGVDMAALRAALVGRQGTRDQGRLRRPQRDLDRHDAAARRGARRARRHRPSGAAAGRHHLLPRLHRLPHG